MKALRFLLAFCFVFTMMIPVGLAFEEEAYAVESGPVGEVKTASGSFSLRADNGYTYDVEYDIQMSWSVDASIGAPGYVGLTWDGEESLIRITNTTEGKKAPCVAIEVFPFYNYEDAVAVYGSSVRNGEQRVVRNGQLDTLGWGEPDPDYEARYVYGYEIGSDSVDAGYLLQAARANPTILYDADNWMSVDESSSYGLEFMDVHSNGTSWSFVPTQTWIVRDDSVNLYTDPVGWMFFPHGDNLETTFNNYNSINFTVIPETYSYKPDAFNADNQQIELCFDLNDTSSSYDYVSYNLIKTAALECAVSYQGDSAVNTLEARLGWVDVEMFDKNTSSKFADHSKYWIAHQTREDGVEVVSVLFTGTDGIREWVSELLNLREFASEDHFGFQLAAGDSLKMLGDYIDRHSIDRTNVSFLIRGHSRGAAVGNVLSKNLVDIYGIQNVKAVLFATPNVYWDKSGDNTMSSIVNIEDGGDLITKLPPGGSKNGIILGYSSDRDVLKQYYSVGSLLTGSFGAEDIFWTHTPENYLARVMSGEPGQEWNASSWQMIDFHCPVDLTVYNEAGDIVASITDNVVSEDNQYFIATDDEAKKTVVLPLDGSFSIMAEGTADGSMEYSVSSFVDGEMIENIEPYTIEFTAGEKFVAVFEGDPSMALLEPMDDSHNAMLGSDALSSDMSLVKPLVSIVLIVLALSIIFIICFRSFKKRRR